MLRILRDFSYRRKRQAVTDFWKHKRNKCGVGPIIFECFSRYDLCDTGNILEFGANWGGNLEYFFERFPRIRAVGVDINDVVLGLAKQHPNYVGIVGDETALARFTDKEFELSFTSSVLDHFPADYVVAEVIDQLVRISHRVVLLEAFIEGVHGDVSNKTRDEVRSGLERGYKPFAEHCYVWNYDRILDKQGLEWSKRPMPLHTASLGPFYHLYEINNLDS